MSEYGVSKRDKRRKSIASKVKLMNDNFEQHRDGYFSEIMHRLQVKLLALKKGTDPEYLERVADLEEVRDYRLTELYLWEQYQIEQAQKQYEKETTSVMEAHENMMEIVRQKLKARLENQRKRLAEDRALLNVSSDFSFFATAANPIIPTTRSAAVAALSGNDRRTLRRGDFGLNSDLSGTETGPVRRRGAAAAIHNSDDSAQSGANTVSERMDLDLLREVDHPRGRGAAKGFNGVKALNNEDAIADLAEIADTAKVLKRKYGE